MQLTVGIGDAKFSDSPDDVLVTFSLGSCIGLVAYDPVLKVGGLVHCLLPLSRMDPERAAVRPEVFADTGVHMLLHRMVEMGAPLKRLVLKLAGGAAPLKNVTVFQIGRRNVEVCRRLLAKNGLRVAAEDTGGEQSRTVYLYLANGRTVIRSPEGEKEL